MRDDWLALLERRFTPAEAERITHVSATLQRKWVQLHFSALPDTAWHWHAERSRGHRRFTWAGIQMLSFFRDTTRDLGSSRGEQLFGRTNDADPVAALEGPPANLTRSDLFENDFREREQGDLFLFLSLIEGAPMHFLTASVPGIINLTRSEWGGRMYVYNLSSMQRALASSVVDLDRSAQDGLSTAVDAL